MPAPRPSRGGLDLGDGLLEDLERSPCLVLAEHQRRRDADRVVAAPEHQQPLAERRLLDRGAWSWSANESPIHSARPRTSVMIGCRSAMPRTPSRKTSPTERALSSRPSRSITLERGERRRARDRRAAVRRAVRAELPGHQVVAGDHRAERQAARDALAGRARRRARRRSCSIAHIVPLRPMPDCTSSQTSRMPWRSQSSRRYVNQPSGGSTYPPSPSTRLDDDRRDLGRRDDALEQHLLEVARSRRRTCGRRSGSSGPKPVRYFALRRGERDRAHRASVERLVERDQVLAAGRVARELDRGLDRLGARVREERACPLPAERRHRVEPLADVGVDRQVEVRRRVVQQLGRPVAASPRPPSGGSARSLVDGDAGVQVQEDVPVDVLDDRAATRARHERVGARERRRGDLAVALDPRHRLAARAPP